MVYNIYYNKSATENKALKGKSYKFSGGGKLIGIAIEREEDLKKTYRLALELTGFVSASRFIQDEFQLIEIIEIL